MWMLDDMIISVASLLSLKFGCLLKAPKLTLLMPNGLDVKFCCVCF